MNRPPYTPLPDVELIATSFLRTHIGVTDHNADVSTELPNPIRLPYITLQRVGGVPVESVWVDEAHVQVSCWGATKEQAFSLAASCRAALFDMQGHRDDAGYVSGVEDLTGLMWMPDTSEDPTLSRYVFGLAVYTHP
jgi:hypothetical protein